MKNQKDFESKLSQLRQQAEMRVQSTAKASQLSEAEAQKLIHELQVHQIELEMQNEELQLAILATEEAVNLYNFAPVGYFILSKGGVIVDVNLSGLQMLGKERSLVIGASFDFFLTDDTKSRLAYFLERVFTNKTKETCELSLPVSDHSLKFILLNAIANGDGENCYVNVVDITNKKLTETFPQEKLDRLLKITKSVPSLVYQFQLYPDGRFCFPFASESVRNYYGVIPEKIRENGESAFEKVHPDDLAGLNDSILVSAQNMSLWQHEFRVILPDGSPQTLLGNSLPQLEKDGSVLWHGFISNISEQKLVEEELHFTNGRLLSIVEATQTGVWEWNVQTNKIVINDIWAQIAGYKSDELCQLDTASFRSMVHPDDQKRSNEFLTRHFSGELPFFDFECRMKHKDGHWIWIHDRGSVISRTDDGKPLLMFGTHADITHRKQIEATLKESEENLQLALAGAQMGMWTLNVKTQYGKVDKCAAQILGYDQDYIANDRAGWNRFIHPDDAPLFNQLLTDHLSGKSPFFITEHRMLQPSGEYRWISGRGKITKYDVDGSPLLISGTILDISERKQAEETLRQSQAFLNSIIENSPNILWISDENGTLIRMNQACRDHLHIQDEEVVGIYNILNDNLIKEQGLLPLVKDVFENGATVRFEISYDTGFVKSVSLEKTTQIILDVNISPKLNLEGKVTNAIIQEIDITERKRAEEALVTQQQLLSKLNQFSIELSRLSSEENLEMFICKRIKELTGAVGVLFSEYKEESRLIAPKHIELEPGILGKVVSRLNKQIQAMHSQVNEQTYQRITQGIIEKYDSLADATFGTISRTASATLSMILKAERYIGVSYLVDGKLYGTSLLAMGKQQPDPPIEFLENIASLVAISLRRKRVEEALKDSEYKYKLLTESNSDIVFIIDKLGRVLFINKSVKPFLGYDPAEVMGKSLTKFIYEKQIPEAFLQLGSAFIHKEVSGFITQIYHKDRHLVDVEINGKIIGLNGQYVGQGTIRDISERKRAEVAILKSKQQYDNLVSKIPVGVYILHSRPDGAFALDYASPRMAEMLGLSVESLLADKESIFNAIHPGDVEGFRTLSRDGIYQHRPFNWKGRIVADGNIKWMHFRSTPEPLENGDALWHGLIVDITERVNAEQEISLKNKELSDLVAEKDKFFSLLAHDLRSPFNSILGFTQMLDEDLPTMEFDQIKHIASVLRNSAFSAYSLLENLLEWSRMKRGMTSYNPETFKLRSKIEESLKSVMELATKKWIEVSMNVPEDLQVLADPNMLGSIIRNLTTNAIKFTPKYGTVLFSAQVNDDQNIEISVKDSGIGMNQIFLDKLFSHDELTNRRGTDGEASSGLGLIICKEFVEKHGGRIWAESEVGEGSTFYFTLPHPMNV